MPPQKKDASHGLIQLWFSPEKEIAILNNMQLRLEWARWSLLPLLQLHHPRAILNFPPIRDLHRFRKQNVHPRGTLSQTTDTIVIKRESIPQISVYQVPKSFPRMLAKNSLKFTVQNVQSQTILQKSLQASICKNRRGQEHILRGLTGSSLLL